MQNAKIWRIKRFLDYYVNEKGKLFRKEKVTSHLHYKSEREIIPNNRNQFVLYRNGKKEYWSKRQLRKILI